MAQFPFFKSLTEKYSDDNRHFLNYMKAGNEFDPFQSWYYVCQWCEQNDYLDEVSEIVGEELTSAQDMEEHEPDVFYKLSSAPVGGRVTISYADGTHKDFVITSKASVDKNALQNDSRVWGASAAPVLALVTCDSSSGWANAQHHTNNFVVWASPA